MRISNLNEDYIIGEKSVYKFCSQNNGIKCFLFDFVDYIRKFISS
jgi:hypothetical protein